MAAMLILHILHKSVESLVISCRSPRHPPPLRPQILYA